MNETMNQRSWWELHLRKARGDILSIEDQRLYEAELDRQERAASPITSKLGALKGLRAEAAELARANTALRSRITDLDQEIRLIEKSLSDETREALGVKE